MIFLWDGKFKGKITLIFFKRETNILTLNYIELIIKDNQGIKDTQETVDAR